MRKLVKLALRYLRGHIRRYLFVIIVLTLGFSFITVASSLSDGMEASVTRAALRHYSGHLFVVGWDKKAGSLMVMDDPDTVDEAIKRAGVPVERVIRRTHLHTKAEVLFQGNAVKIKDLFGVDFQDEADLLEGLEYTAGTFDPGWDQESIIISKPAAEQLQVRVGDRITLRLENRRRQVDTRFLVVRAIMADSSLYGYARAYMDREALTGLMDMGAAEFSTLGILLPNLKSAPVWARRVRAELEELVPVAGPIETKEDLTSNIRMRWDGVRYFTIPLQVYISEVTDLLSAMEAGAYGLLGMILLVVAASVVVTYRVVLHERIREIGTMVAVGFPRYWIVLMLMTEALILVLAGIICGVILSFGITYIFSLFSFHRIPGFALFMEAGSLRARYTARSLAANIFIVVGTVVPVISVMVISLLRRKIPSLIKGE